MNEHPLKYVIIHHNLDNKRAAYVYCRSIFGAVCAAFGMSIVTNELIEVWGVKDYEDIFKENTQGYQIAMFDPREGVPRCDLNSLDLRLMLEDAFVTGYNFPDLPFTDFSFHFIRENKHTFKGNCSTCGKPMFEDALGHVYPTCECVSGGIPKEEPSSD